MRMFIVKQVCPSNHPVMAAAYDADVGNFNAVVQLLKDKGAQAMPEGVHCPVCGSTDLKFEESPSDHKSLEEAQPTILGMLEAQTKEAMNSVSVHTGRVMMKGDKPIPGSESEQEDGITSLAV